METGLKAQISAEEEVSKRLQKVHNRIHSQVAGEKPFKIHDCLNFILPVTPNNNTKE